MALHNKKKCTHCFFLACSLPKRLPKAPDVKRTIAQNVRHATATAQMCRKLCDVISA